MKFLALGQMGRKFTFFLLTTSKYISLNYTLYLPAKYYSFFWVAFCMLQNHLRSFIVFDLWTGVIAKHKIPMWLWIKPVMFVLEVARLFHPNDSETCNVWIVMKCFKAAFGVWCKKTFIKYLGYWLTTAIALFLCSNGRAVAGM